MSENQKWKIVRTPAGDSFSKPVQTLVMFNDEPVGFVQGYSVGQNVGNQYETLILEIASPKVEFVNVTDEEMAELLGRESKYKEGGEEVVPTEDELEFAQQALSAEGEKVDSGS